MRSYVDLISSGHHVEGSPQGYNGKEKVNRVRKRDRSTKENKDETENDLRTRISKV